MEENGIIDMQNPTTKFCVSIVCVNVASVGVQIFTQAWNCHPIAGVYGIHILCITTFMFYVLHAGGGTPTEKAKEWELLGSQEESFLLVMLPDSST